MEIKKLTELLEKNDYEKVTNLLLKKDWKNLRILLNSEPLKTKLEKRGVLADYLYYALQSQL